MRLDLLQILRFQQRGTTILSSHWGDVAFAMQLQNLQFNLLQIIITCFDWGLYSHHPSSCLIFRRCFECQRVFEIISIYYSPSVILWSSGIAVFLLSWKSSYLNCCLSFVFENNIYFRWEWPWHWPSLGASWEMQIRTLKQDVPLPHSLEQSETKIFVKNVNTKSLHFCNSFRCFKSFEHLQKLFVFVLMRIYREAPTELIRGNWCYGPRRRLL